MVLAIVPFRVCGMDWMWIFTRAVVIILRMILVMDQMLEFATAVASICDVLDVGVCGGSCNGT